MKKAILVAIIGAMTLGVNAGDWGKAPVAVDKTPIEECYDIGGEISAGYMTDYIFHGARIARDTVWTDANYTLDSIVPITVGATYFSAVNGIVGAAGIDKLDVYASAAIGTFGGFDTDLSYTHYFFTGAGVSFGNIGLDMRRSLGFADLVLGTNYAVGNGNVISNGWYHTAGVEKTFGLTDAASLVLGAGLGYHDNYGVAGFSGWSNYYVTAALPIELNCRATLTPYVGYNGTIYGTGGTQRADVFGPRANSNGDVLHAGVSLSVSF